LEPRCIIFRIRNISGTRCIIFRIINVTDKYCAEIRAPILWNFFLKTLLCRLWDDLEKR
jgi:hypothetical protein